jgi:hypothetical protein
MNIFNSFGEFGLHLLTMVARDHILEHEALEEACKQIEERAKEKIGHDEQPAAGPFAAWKPLAQSTIEEKEYLGYVDHLSPNDSLLRTGEMRDSIEHKVIGHKGHVGSNSESAFYQELGTASIPARSFLGGAAFELAPHIAKEIGIEFGAFLAGGGKRIVVR